MSVVYLSVRKLDRDLLPESRVRLVVIPRSLLPSHPDHEMWCRDGTTPMEPTPHSEEGPLTVGSIQEEKYYVRRH